MELLRNRRCENKFYFSTHLFEVRTCEFDDSLLILYSDSVVIAINDAHIKDARARSEKWQIFGRHVALNCDLDLRPRRGHLMIQ